LLLDRDPHVDRTLDAFRNSLQWIARGEFTDTDVHEALLSVMASLDAPVAPSQVSLPLSMTMTMV
jgi:Zn-dependent M16 (insulinase) family peptidase